MGRALRERLRGLGCVPWPILVSFILLNIEDPSDALSHVLYKKNGLPCLASNLFPSVTTVTLTKILCLDGLAIRIDAQNYEPPKALRANHCKHTLQVILGNQTAQEDARNRISPMHTHPSF